MSEAAPIEAAPARARANPTRRRYRTLVVRRLVILGALALVVIGGLVADLMLGPARYSVGDVVAAILSPEAVRPAVRVVIWDIRLPVALMAVLTGASLAIAGALMQTILNNPLASPFTLGISAAAGFGASLALAFGVALVPLAPDYVVPLNAFVMAAAAALLIHALARLRGVTGETMILVGIALVFTFNALMSLLQFFSSDQALAAIVFWTMGSLTKATWTKLALTGAVLALVLPFFVRNAWALTALRLGDDKAASFGVPVGRLRLQTMLLVSLLAAVPVSFVGTIGFVGIVGPHIARLLVGEEQRYFLPASALAGAAILSVASVASKSILPGLVFPISIVTALIGLPFFFALVLGGRRHAS
ncbi:FecCD family ABC transporter permease [Methyloraptor flagellatus]|uniref:Iron ABC transporter permease n=1 Tax=Methyloraptor flagellatus TaxID=3162530 RepID=A0AAU7XC78_9HYPH